MDDVGCGLASIWPDVLTLVLTLLYNVLAGTFPSVMIQTWATYPFPLITLLIGVMLVWVARQEKQ